MTAPEEHRPTLRHWGRDVEGPAILHQHPFEGRVFSNADEALAAYFGGDVEPADWVALPHSSRGLLFWWEGRRDAAGVAVFTRDSENTRGFRFVIVSEPERYQLEFVAVSG